MQHVASQLKAVRQTGRVLLVLRRSAQLLAVLMPLAIVLGLLDYALRLPGPMRLLIGLIVIAGAGYWLATRLNRALRFWPSLAELALRAERLHPQLAGSLASAVEFSLAPAGYQQPTSTAAMAESAVNEMQAKSEGVNLKKLIKLKPTMKALGCAALSAVVLMAVVLTAPGASATAAQRWFMPLGDTQWPKVNQVQVLTSDKAVFPADGKVRLRASITRGWTEGMRMTFHYRVLDEAGEGRWTSVTVAEQPGREDDEDPIYEARIDVPAATARALMSGKRNSAVLEVRYHAGDDNNQRQSLTLAARPEITQVNVTATPPDYALGLTAEQRTPLHEQPDRIASTSAYIGSRITAQVRFNKPLPRERAEAAAEPWVQLIGEGAALELIGTDDTVDGFTIRWALKKTVVGSFVLTDDFGLTSTDDEKKYRIQAIEDESPVVLLIKPAIDESVLPNAVVQLSAAAEDDIAVEKLRLDIVVPDRKNTAEDAEQIATRSLDASGLLKTGRRETMELDYTLNLEPLALLPGDEVVITAYGQDIYKLDGIRHDEVASETRRLRVITEQQLADQVRRALRGVRNTAQSVQRKQRAVAGRTESSPPAETAEQQADISRRIAAQQDAIDALRQRIKRNNPKGLEGLERLLDRADGLLDESRKQSDAAQAALNEAADQKKQGDQADKLQQEKSKAGDAEGAKDAADQKQQAQKDQKKSQGDAKQAQDKAREKLAELIAALDMGESVGEIESELSALKSDAEQVAKNTAKLLPKTVGQDPDKLPEDLKKQLQDNADKQREIAKRAEELVDKMRATAEEIGNEGETPEQRATAKTMTKAADIAKREGLEENADKAADQLDENRPVDAATQQQKALQTLDQMLEEMGKQQQRRQEELKRLMQELAQKVQKLVEDQRSQLASAKKIDAKQLGGLEQPLFALRKRTMVVEELAMQAQDTESAGAELAEAVFDQAEALKAMRVTDKQAAVAGEEAALAHLEQALALINEQNKQEEQDKKRQERLKLKQAYEDLAKRQGVLLETVTQHQRDEDYSRRDWRQINRLHEEKLEDKTFEETQQAIRDKAMELNDEVGEAMIYKSMHRRIDNAAATVGTKLAERRIDEAAINEQKQIIKMLLAMAEALNDSADPDKFEKPGQDGNNGNKKPGEGGQGEPPEPPLVPDLAQIKLLREAMIMLREQTVALDRAGDKLTPEQRETALEEIAETQRELKELGEQILEKLREQMQRPEIEPRN